MGHNGTIQRWGRSMDTTVVLTIMVTVRAAWIYVKTTINEFMNEPDWLRRPQAHHVRLWNASA
jgi:hypothetical protein